jgi:uncharacterized protein YcgI (DUF1989 family)
MIFDPGNSAPGAYVELRFEMDTLVLLHTCPHPLDPAREYPRKPVLVQFRAVRKPSESELRFTEHAENRRGFENNRLYHLHD